MVKKNEADYLIELPKKRILKLESNYDDYIFRLGKVQKALFDRIRSSLKNNYNMAQIQASLRQLEAWLKQAGYEQEYKKYVLDLEKLKHENTSFFSEMAKISNDNTLAVTFSTLDNSALKTFSNQMILNYEVIGSRAVTEIGNFLLSEIGGGRTPFPKFVKRLREKIIGKDAKGGSLKKYAYTYANDSALSYDREMNFRLAEKTNLKYWLYTGGRAIKTTRKFCLAHLDKYYTMSEIENMNNGQGTSVKTRAGGWNCRHELIALPDSILKSGGKRRG